MGETEKSRNTFIRMVEMLEFRTDLHEVVEDVVARIVKQGAQSKECYCVQVCTEVQSWFEKNDFDNISVEIGINGIIGKGRKI